MDKTTHRFCTFLTFIYFIHVMCLYCSIRERYIEVKEIRGSEIVLYSGEILINEVEPLFIKYNTNEIESILRKTQLKKQVVKILLFGFNKKHIISAV